MRERLTGSLAPAFVVLFSGLSSFMACGTEDTEVVGITATSGLGDGLGMPDGFGSTGSGGSVGDSGSTGGGGGGAVDGGGRGVDAIGRLGDFFKADAGGMTDAVMDVATPDDLAGGDLGSTPEDGGQATDAEATDLAGGDDLAQGETGAGDDVSADDTGTTAGDATDDGGGDDAGAGQGPSITVVSPQDGAVVSIGEAVHFEIQVSDPDDPAADLTVTWTTSTTPVPLSSGPASDPSQLSFDLSNLAPGKQIITVEVKDKAGNVTTKEIALLVNSAPGTPVVTSHAPPPRLPTHVRRPHGPLHARFPGLRARPLFARTSARRAGCKGAQKGMSSSAMRSWSPSKSRLICRA